MLPRRGCPRPGPVPTGTAQGAAAPRTPTVGPGKNRAPTPMAFSVSPRVPACQGAREVAVLIRCAGAPSGKGPWRLVALGPWRGGTLAVLAGRTTASNPARHRCAPERPVRLTDLPAAPLADRPGPRGEDRPEITLASSSRFDPTPPCKGIRPAGPYRP